MSDTAFPTPDDVTDFVNMSAVLTGIAADVLKPAFPVNDVYNQILLAAHTDNPTAYASLISRYKADMAAGNTDAQIVTDLMSGGGADSLLAKCIIIAWYSGTWYVSATLYTGGKSWVLSADAYTAGYMWQVAQAHAMGSADYPFGYWNEPPPALSNFITAS